MNTREANNYKEWLGEEHKESKKELTEVEVV